MAIVYEEVLTGDIEQCRELCNELMQMQKAKAILHPEYFGGMNFTSRMQASYANALRKQVIVAKDNGQPIGYVFSTIDTVTAVNKSARPAWAPQSRDLGFYPDWLEVPQQVGCLSNLYLREAYRSSGLGSQLLAMAVRWLESFDDVCTSFVYISNGNKAALDFYTRHGFIYSHDVFGGFIQAAYKKQA